MGMEIVIGVKGGGARHVGSPGSVQRNYGSRHGRVVHGGWGGRWGWGDWGWPYYGGSYWPYYAYSYPQQQRASWAQIQEAYRAWRAAFEAGASPDVLARLQARFEALLAG